MKYVITDHNKVAMGTGCNHQALALALTGKVVAAGEFRVVGGRVEVYGESFGYGIKARPEDAEVLQRLFT